MKIWFEKGSSHSVNFETLLAEEEEGEIEVDVDEVVKKCKNKIIVNVPKEIIDEINEIMKL